MRQCKKLSQTTEVVFLKTELRKLSIWFWILRSVRFGFKKTDILHFYRVLHTPRVEHVMLINDLLRSLLLKKFKFITYATCNHVQDCWSPCNITISYLQHLSSHTLLSVSNQGLNSDGASQHVTFPNFLIKKWQKSNRLDMHLLDQLVSVPLDRIYCRRRRRHAGQQACAGHQSTTWPRWNSAAGDNKHTNKHR